MAVELGRVPRVGVLESSKGDWPPLQKTQACGCALHSGHSLGAFPWTLAAVSRSVSTQQRTSPSSIIPRPSSDSIRFSSFSLSNNNHINTSSTTVLAYPHCRDIIFPAKDPWEQPKRLTQIPSLPHPHLTQHLPLPCHWRCAAPHRNPAEPLAFPGDAAAEQPIGEIGARALRERHSQEGLIYIDTIHRASSLPPSYNSPSLAIVLRLPCVPRNTPPPLIDSSFNHPHCSAFFAPLRKTTRPLHRHQPSIQATASSLRRHYPPHIHYVQPKIRRPRWPSPNLSHTGPHRCRPILPTHLASAEFTIPLPARRPKHAARLLRLPRAPRSRTLRPARPIQSARPSPGLLWRTTESGLGRTARVWTAGSDVLPAAGATTARILRG
jgi:hypothetical protein